MKTFKEEQKTIKVVDSLTCNICELELNGDDANSGVDVTYTGHYDSRRIGDMTIVNFAICEDCLCDKIFPLFKIPATESSKLIID